MLVIDWIKRKLKTQEGIKALNAGNEELEKQRNIQTRKNEKPQKIEECYQIDMSKIFDLNKGGSIISVENFDKKAMLLYYMAKGEEEGKHYFPIAKFKDVRDLRVGEIRDNFDKYMKTFLIQCGTPSHTSKNFYNTFYIAKMNQPEYRLELTPEFEEIFSKEHLTDQFQIKSKTPFTLSEERIQALEEMLEKQREEKNTRKQFSNDLKFDATKVPTEENDLTQEDIKEILNNTDRELMTKPLSEEDMVTLAKQRIKRIQLARSVDKKSIVEKYKELLIQELLVEDIRTKYTAPYEQTASQLLEKSNLLVEKAQNKKQTRFDVYQQYESEIAMLRAKGIQIVEKEENQRAILTDFWKERVEAYRREEDLLIQKYNTIAIKRGYTPFQEEGNDLVQE